LVGLVPGDQASAAEPTEEWVLQRFGEDPLDHECTLDALGVVDGDVLHLRRRSSRFNPIVFDDLVEGVASAVADRPDRWRPDMTRRLFVGLAVAALVVVFLGLLIPGNIAVRCGIAGISSLALLIGAGLSAQKFPQRESALVLGGFAPLFAGLCGFLLPVAGHAVQPECQGSRCLANLALSSPQSAQVLTAGAVSAVVTLIAWSVIDSAGWVFLSGVVSFAGVAVAGLLSMVFHLQAYESAAILASLAFGLFVLAPTTAARLVRIRLPQPPSDETDLQLDIEPVPGEELLEKTVRAEQYLNGFGVAAGALCAGSLAVLAASRYSLPLLLFVGILGGGLLLRGRVLVSAWQRMAAVAPGVFAVLVDLRWLIQLLPVAVRPYALIGVGCAAVPLLFASSYLPGRRLMPFWGRSADILEMILGIALVPVLLDLLHVYSWARGLAG
jgi:type VII secretion integral membrane protein EccD